MFSYGSAAFRTVFSVFDCLPAGLAGLIGLVLLRSLVRLILLRGLVRLILHVAHGKHLFF